MSLVPNYKEQLIKAMNDLIDGINGNGEFAGLDEYINGSHISVAFKTACDEVYDIGSFHDRQDEILDFLSHQTIDDIFISLRSIEACAREVALLLSYRDSADKALFEDVFNDGFKSSSLNALHQSRKEIDDINLLFTPPSYYESDVDVDHISLDFISFLNSNLVRTLIEFSNILPSDSSLTLNDLKGRISQLGNAFSGFSASIYEIVDKVAIIEDCYDRGYVKERIERFV